MKKDLRHGLSRVEGLVCIIKEYALHTSRIAPTVVDIQSKNYSPSTVSIIPNPTAHVK